MDEVDASPGRRLQVVLDGIDLRQHGGIDIGTGKFVEQVHGDAV